MQLNDEDNREYSLAYKDNKIDPLYEKLVRLGLYELRIRCLDKNFVFKPKNLKRKVAQMKENVIGLNYQYKNTTTLIYNTLIKERKIECTQMSMYNNERLGVDDCLILEPTEYFSKTNFNPFDINYTINYKINDDIVNIFKNKWLERNNTK